eukprot:TRINITY_DN13010_c0_g1_i1.p1 TRINITY_DN13010_c0_g1~~TRINITY_DN13010_c0_g1_i1.p1  ORF type:complete len:361 (+),score=76.33 TRINITY_DN13010_c0_g1_i1:119-1201(+)
MEATSPYYTSFSKDDKEGYLAFFNENGFVVIDDIISQEDCKASQQEVWTYLEQRGVDALDTATWNTAWPSEICRNGGFMGRFPFFGKMNKDSLRERGISTQLQAWKNRTHPEVHRAFATLFGEEQLWATIDRYGIMRPTILLDSEKGKEAQTPEAPAPEPEAQEGNGEKCILKEEWKTKRNWLHWDLSPFHFGTSAAGYILNPEVSFESLRGSYGGLRVQGLINLVDCTEEVGGFHCVPKFHGERFMKWREDNWEYGQSPEIVRRNFVEVPEDDPMRAEVIRVPMKAGSLLIWNSQLPHGNFPNSSDRFRMVQYIKAIPVSDAREFHPVGYSKNFPPEDMFPEGWEPSELGKKMFGLQEW